MANMIAFCTAILSAICDFLMSEPIFYLFSLVCFMVVVSIFVKLIKNNR